MNTFKNKFHLATIGLIMAVSTVFSSSCHEDCDNNPNVQITSKDLSFSAKNLTLSSTENIVANSIDATITVNWEITTNINGNETTIVVPAKKNELPVEAGNEIEITFKPGNMDERNVTYFLPDGTSKTVSADNPAFNWTVPDNFKPGMKIIGECKYKINETSYIVMGEISLIAVR